LIFCSCKSSNRCCSSTNKIIILAIIFIKYLETNFLFGLENIIDKKSFGPIRIEIVLDCLCFSNKLFFVHRISLKKYFDIRITFRKDIEIKKRSSWNVKLNFLTGIIDWNLWVESSDGSETAVTLRVHYESRCVYKSKYYIV